MTYPIGTPGTPWGPDEVAQWRAAQVVRRSYADEVEAQIERLRTRFEVGEYGRLDYSPDVYRLHAVRSREWDESLPVALVSGGVHGYETSGGCGFAAHKKPLVPNEYTSLRRCDKGAPEAIWGGEF